MDPLQQSDDQLFSNDGEEDLLLFENEDEQKSDEILSEEKPWKLMIVDDDKEVHNVTHMVLAGYQYMDKGIEFINAYSGAEAKELIKAHPDTAIILLDVVMETDNAGLEVVRHIREELDNKFVRIILRTGQPGAAPEQKVIVDYDINDYKDKSELTSRKLFTAITTSLRGFRDLRTIEENRQALESNKLGLEKIIQASSSIFELQSLQEFARGALIQIESLFGLNLDPDYLEADGFAATTRPPFDGFAASDEGNELTIIAGTGHYNELIGKKVKEVIPAEILTWIDQSMNEKQCIFADRHYVHRVECSDGIQNVLYVGRYGAPLGQEANNAFIEILNKNISIAFQNVYLNREIEETQREIIYTLGEVIEVRSQETGQHVKRVGEYAKQLALLTGLDEKQSELIKMASPMHDAGKVGVPDSVLHKPGRLTPDEVEIIRTHANLGYEMLRGSKRPVLQEAATIAHEHHERFDGTGYPRGLKGEEIAISARITSIADVFDALYCNRVYRKAWPLERVIDLFKEEQGKAFDPALVDLFLDNLPLFLKIKEQFPD